MAHAAHSAINVPRGSASTSAVWPASVANEALLEEVACEAGVAEGRVPLEELLLKDAPSLR